MGTLTSHILKSFVRIPPRNLHFQASFLTGSGPVLGRGNVSLLRPQLAHKYAENISVELSHAAVISEVATPSMEQSVVGIHARGCVSSAKWRGGVSVV